MIIGTLCSTIDDKLIKLENDGRNLDSIESHDESILLFMSEIIDELNQKVIQVPK